MIGRVLVTGAAGFIGSNLCLELSRAGREVVGLDDFSVGHFENLRGFKGDLVTADIGDADFWGPRVGKIDSVFHEAAVTDTTVMDQAKMMRVNTEAFRSLLNWAEKTKVKSVVYASSAGVYGDSPAPMRESAAPKPLNIYAFSKMMMERVAEEFLARGPKPGTRVVGVRYFNVFGPGESFKGKAASMIWQLYLQMKAGRRPRIFEFGEQFRDFIYVKDVVQANLLAEKKAKSGAYNVCTGRKTSFNEIVACLNEVLGTRFEPEYFKNPYSFYQNETLGDPSKAKTFGFSARYATRDAIRDYLGRLVPAGV